MLPTFDRAYFHEVWETERYGHAGACQIIEHFIEHTSCLPASLERAVLDRDGPSAQALLHRLKGSAGSLGGAHLAHMCSLLQSQEDSTSMLGRSDGQAICEAYSEFVAALRDEHARLSFPSMVCSVALSPLPM
jgi:HPt (histidine-containing phosphotransfer) domain-containing protein